MYFCISAALSGLLAGRWLTGRACGRLLVPDPVHDLPLTVDLEKGEVVHVVHAWPVQVFIMPSK
jgi:hypothetical protein